MKKITILILLLLSFNAYSFRAGFACIGNYLYLPNGLTKHVGHQNCIDGKVSNNVACINGYLYLPNGLTKYVDDNCISAKLGNGYACVDGYLYLPNGLTKYVGDNGCFTANLGN